MIIQSPESAMPEPFKTYVRQRSETIADVLSPVIKDADVQLCPRAITEDEYVFAGSENAIVYGVIVKSKKEGFKSDLYNPTQPKTLGIATDNIAKALAYGQAQFVSGNRVRVKDPRESDGQGQQTVEDSDELGEAFYALGEGSPNGVVLMPHLETISHRASLGYINLGRAGTYLYLGREETTRNNDKEVYGGTQLGLFHGQQFFDYKKFRKIEEKLEVPRILRQIGKSTLTDYFGRAMSPTGDIISLGDKHVGRVSFDVVQDITDNGTPFAGVIDVTPRVGGTTPAEVLAIREIRSDRRAICYASSKLYYETKNTPKSGVNFIDTDSLVINAQIEDVTK